MINKLGQIEKELKKKKAELCDTRINKINDMLKELGDLMFHGTGLLPKIRKLINKYPIHQILSSSIKFSDKSWEYGYTVYLGRNLNIWITTGDFMNIDCDYLTEPEIEIKVLFRDNAHDSVKPEWLKIDNDLCLPSSFKGRADRQSIDKVYARLENFINKMKSNNTMGDIETRLIELLEKGLNE